MFKPTVVWNSSECVWLKANFVPIYYNLIINFKFIVFQIVQTN